MTNLKNFRYPVYLVSATFLMGSSFVASKILLQHNPPIALASVRFSVAGVFTLILIAATGGSLTLSRALFLRTLLIGIFQTATCMGFLFLCIARTSAPLASVLLFTNPMWVTVWGAIFLREKLKVWQILGLVCGFSGVVLTVGIGQTSGFDGLGIVFGLLSAICWSIATIIGRTRPDAANPLLVNGFQMLFGALLLFGWSFASETKSLEITTTSDWSWFLWLAIPASAGSFGFWFSALKLGGAIRSSSYLFLTPLFTMLLSVPILGNLPTALQLLGFILVGAGLYLINRQSETVKN